jgi:hypothetical protein
MCLFINKPTFIHAVRGALSAGKTHIGIMSDGHMKPAKHRVAGSLFDIPVDRSWDEDYLASAEFDDWVDEQIMIIDTL